ncbi:TraR/DksA C4-type zinc finger protein [Sulfobacillus sp. hq2]|uniref:TraR/DksA C4-type zinc finger protein n=1 Tax=Sulfobacillus TaxID=28033 RepID=UPI000CD06B4C|nr:TraR/DksA C4-type zinc finger protein [Sulfobacillus sp. hq2]POB10866.1 conjugal transfer protein TraR [Sulfobacillus sp. hq2]
MDPIGRLQAVQRQLENMLVRLRSQLSVKETDSVGALSAYDNHPADLATDTAARELDVGIERGLAEQQAEVTRAIEKVAEGSYGICDRCQQAIEPERLKAKPEAIYCITCQKVVEPPYIPLDHPVVPMPFGDRDDIHHGDVATDGEDIWQSIAQWGTSNSPQDTPPAVDYHETYVGFDEPVGFVEQVESIVDENGEPLLDALRVKMKRQARSTEEESSEYPS